MPIIIQHRKPAPRFITSLPVVLSKGEVFYVAETKNLSDTGLCLRSEELFPVGTQLHLVFGKPPELPRLSTEGIVRWSKDGKGVGVEFTSMKPGDYEALLKFVISQYRRDQV
jgi:hypothetical protein